NLGVRRSAELSDHEYRFAEGRQSQTHAPIAPTSKADAPKLLLIGLRCRPRQPSSKYQAGRLLLPACATPHSRREPRSLCEHVSPTQRSHAQPPFAAPGSENQADRRPNAAPQGLFSDLLIEQRAPPQNAHHKFRGQGMIGRRKPGVLRRMQQFRSVSVLTLDSEQNVEG